MSTEGRALAVSVMPLETRRDAILHIATTADELGYDAFVLPEAWTYDGTVLLAEVATRKPSDLPRHGHRQRVEPHRGDHRDGGRHAPRGLAPGRVIVQFRALLAGDRVPLATMPAARPLRLGTPAVPELPIYVAGLTQPSIRLTGELADGWLPFLFPRNRLGDGERLLREGTASTRRAPRRWSRAAPRDSSRI